MDDKPKYVLFSLINKYGRSICGDSGRLEGMLRDLCGENKKEIFVLVHALKGGVAEALMRTERKIPTDAIINTQTARLCDMYGFSRDISLWATETWAEALGILDIPQLQSETDEITATHKETDGESIIKLINALGDDRFEVRADAVEILIDAGDCAVPSLINSISDHDQGVRWRIAFILGEICSPESINSLEMLVDDPSDSVREVAEEALRKVKEKH